MTVFIRGNVKLRIPAKENYIRDITVHFGDWNIPLTKGIVDANSPSHSLLTLNSGENLGRVLESDWTFTQRVAYSK
jgi:hypothetical protein